MINRTVDEYGYAVVFRCTRERKVQYIVVLFQASLRTAELPFAVVAR
jgi:hypothetical protein